MKKQSPYSKKVSIRQIAAAAGEYTTLSGNQIFQRLDCPQGTVILLLDALTNKQQMVGPLANWKALKLIEKMIEGEKKVDYNVVAHLDPRFKLPTTAAPLTNFKMPVPHLSRETYQALIEELSDDLLAELLQLFKDEYDFMCVSHNYVPDSEMRSQMDAVHRYIKVKQNHGGWDAKPKRNLKVLLKRYRQWVMQAVNKEYKAGTKVFPEKYGVHLV